MEVYISWSPELTSYKLTWMGICCPEIAFLHISFVQRYFHHFFSLCVSLNTFSHSPVTSHIKMAFLSPQDPLLNWIFFGHCTKYVLKYGQDDIRLQQLKMCDFSELFILRFRWTKTKYCIGVLQLWRLIENTWHRLSQYNAQMNVKFIIRW